MRIYLIGIAGAGMHSLALYLSDAGHEVSGSDPWISEERQAFWRDRGCTIAREQKAENIAGYELVIYSAAVPPSNPERFAAESRGIAMSRGEALAKFANAHGGSIAVCGTHGKGTTAGAILCALNEAHVPTSDVLGAVPIGFVQPSLCRKNAQYLVCEVDESDRTNRHHRPAFLLINNVEEDHLNVYRDLEDIVASFAEHVRSCLAFGSRVAIHYAGVGAPLLYEKLKDCAGIDWICEQGVLAHAALEWRIEEPDENGCCWVHLRTSDGQSQAFLPHLGGRANAQNLACAACVLGQLGMRLEAMVPALSGYRGLKDRCHIQRYGAKMLVTDYASHPTCVRNDIEWLRPLAKRIVVIYHPYRYSLMQCHWHRLAQELSLADCVLLAPLDGAGEAVIEGLTSADLAHRIAQNRQGCEARDFDSFEALEAEAKALLEPGDCLLVFGGGSLFQLGHRVCAG